LKWDSKLELRESGRVRRICIYGDANPLSNSDIVRLWQCDAGFREFFTALLASAPFEAFLWETRPVTTDSLDQSFEFVLLDCAALKGVQADRVPFGKQLEFPMADDNVVTFFNLSGDAVLIAPCEGGPLCAYPHIAAFVRHGEKAQQHALWTSVGAAMQRHIGEEPTWLSTSGLGVFWLHIRLDTFPKYYKYKPYRDDT